MWRHGVMKKEEMGEKYREREDRDGGRQTKK